MPAWPEKSLHDRALPARSRRTRAAHPRASLERMRREVVTRRLPLAVLGALAALLVGAALPSAVPAAAVGAAHAAAGSGHVTDGLLGTAHVRTVTHLPVALPAATSSSSDRPPAPTSATAPAPLRPLAATPPTAIRGRPCWRSAADPLTEGHKDGRRP